MIHTLYVKNDVFYLRDEATDECFAEFRKKLESKLFDLLGQKPRFAKVRDRMCVFYK